MKSLEIEHNQAFSDDAFEKSISKLSKLEILNIDDCKKFTGESLAAIAPDNQLKKLDLSNIEKVANEGLGIGLGKMQNLESLEIGYSPQVNDLAMSQLDKAVNLKELKIYDASITDKSLKILAKLKHLRKLNLQFTFVTDQGIADFRKERPDCRIEFSKNA